MIPAVTIALISLDDSVRKRTGNWNQTTWLIEKTQNVIVYVSQYLNFKICQKKKISEGNFFRNLTFKNISIQIARNSIFFLQCRFEVNNIVTKLGFNLNGFLSYGFLWISESLTQQQCIDQMISYLCDESSSKLFTSWLKKVIIHVGKRRS